MLTLHIKLSRTAKALKKWAQLLAPQGRLALAICREVVQQLDIAQESRALSDPERELKKTLKHRILGLAAIEKARARQKSRVTWIRKGDANTTLFQQMANNRKKKNYIYSLQSEVGIHSSQSEKHNIIFEHFYQHLAKHSPRMHSLNFAALGFQPKNLDHLEVPFSAEEIKNVVMHLPKEKTPALMVILASFSPPAGRSYNMTSGTQ